MPFFLSHVCDLLEKCTETFRQDPRADHRAAVRVWFETHRAAIADPATDLAALLSALLPEKRTDRVYELGETRLERLFGDVQGLGSTRRRELGWYRTDQTRGMDLGDCVAHIITPTNIFNPKNEPVVTVEQVDTHLHRVASRVRWSSPLIRAVPAAEAEIRRGWQNLLTRVSPREGKWLVRMILRDYRPVVLDPAHLFACCHPLLPALLRVQNEFCVAVNLLQDVRKRGLLATTTTAGMGLDARAAIMAGIRPRMGVQVGRQTWLKGRSVKNCRDMLPRWASVQKKMDGEYCQVHVDLTRPRREQITIFSKSGKDSTEDRRGLHSAIRDSLSIGTNRCKIVKGCILEGELLVFSNRTKKIGPFHAIRKYVSRRGHYIGTGQDSPRHEWEHLMIVYFDALLIDDESLLGMNESGRFRRLQDLVVVRPGHSQLVEREAVDLYDDGVGKLREMLARSIVSHGEGIVVKPDEPYFSFGRKTRPHEGCPIKLKAGYIQGFGDVGDFAVVGARYDHAKARQLRIDGHQQHQQQQYTHFLIGCLQNKERHVRFRERPEFVVVNEVEVNSAAQLGAIRLGRRRHVPYGNETAAMKLTLDPAVFPKPPAVVFIEPLVFDMRSFQFERLPGAAFWSLRHPTVGAVHLDRDWGDVLAYDTLQSLAEQAREEPADVEDDSQRLEEVVERLRRADPGGIAVDTETPPGSWPRFSPGTVHAAALALADSSQLRAGVNAASKTQILQAEDEGAEGEGAEDQGAEEEAAEGDEVEDRPTGSRKRPGTGAEMADQPSMKQPRLSGGQGPESCRFGGGEKCHFAHRSVALSDHLRGLGSHPVWAVLRAHGITPVDDGEWGKRSRSLTERRKLYLVDAKSECARDHMSRKSGLPAMTTGSAEVPEVVPTYDWRMLEAMGRIEDDRCVDKKLGGWSDPWRRWFVGYVRLRGGTRIIGAG